MKIISVSENQKIEKRIAISPEIAKKYIALGLEVSLSENYGEHLGFKDSEYKSLGVKIYKDIKEIIDSANVIVQLGLPSDEITSLIKENQTPYYGYVTDIRNAVWENIDLNSFYSKMSQEHGIIKADKNCFEKYNVGDVIGVIPIHSCMTADLFDQYATSEGRIMRL